MATVEMATEDYIETKQHQKIVKKLHKTINDLNRRNQELFNELIITKEIKACEEQGYKDDREGWINEIQKIREESNKKVLDAEYNYKQEANENYFLRLNQATYNNYIKKLENLLKENSISFQNQYREFQDAMKEINKM